MNTQSTTLLYAFSQVYFILHRLFPHTAIHQYQLSVLFERRLHFATEVSEGLHQLNVLYSTIKLMLTWRQKVINKLYLCIQFIYYFV